MPRTTTRTTLLIIILAVLHAAYAFPRPNITNAARMRAGLGPLKPRALFNPTRVRGARETNPSGSPPAPIPTQIEVRDSSGVGHIGYIQKALTAGILTVSDANNHWAVSSPGAGSGLFNIDVTSPIGYPYLGFAVDSDPGVNPINAVQTGSPAYMVATYPNT
ncbi:hypothetical protein C8R47DRAFT_1205951 [Mycena vitilis]|nr:hypothetical protein C8R47DRAFT_1205951 [Mycena vitilis]